MRWPIQFQLLVPMLSVVVLAIALASLGSAYFGGRRARQAQEESLAPRGRHADRRPVSAESNPCCGR